MTDSQINLAGLFQAVTSALIENKQPLNQADEYNQNHGDNMVQTFATITNALQQKPNSSNSAALSYAASQLENATHSTSGQQYAQNLQTAAAQLQGKSLDTQTAMTLLQMLIGGGQASTTNTQSNTDSADPLAALLGGLSGGAQSNQSASQGGDLLTSLFGAPGGDAASNQSLPTEAPDLLGSLLGGLTGQSQAGQSQSSQPAQSGFELLNAGLAFLQARQSGKDTGSALLQAFMAGSGMGDAAHRAQSTQIVVDSFLKALGTMSATQG